MSEDPTPPGHTPAPPAPAPAPPMVVCPRCGERLDGLPADAACPVCRIAVSEAIAAAMDEQGGIVEDDRPCVSCGYNIRGLPVAGTCPECGKPVSVSLRGRLLRYASPAYLAMLHRGAMIVEAAIAAHIGLVVVSVLVGWWWLAPGAAVPLWMKAARIAADSATTVISVLGLIGWWMLSSRDPGEGPDAPGRRARLVLRWGVAAQLAAAVASLAIGAVLSAAPAGPASPALLTAQGVLELAEALVWIVAFFAGLTSIRHLALRIPDRALASRAGGLRTFAAVLMGALVVTIVGLAVLYGLLAGTTAAPGVGALAGLAACVGLPVLGVSAFVAFILYILLIDRVRAALGAERRPAPLVTFPEPGGE